MNKRGQSIIEYALIGILVLTGILVAGPYVLRSINAHFKLWDEGVQDSFHEHIHQAPVNAIPDMNFKCTCTADVPGACGSNNSGSPCSLGNRIYNHSCVPQDCDGEPYAKCQADSGCCTGWVKTGCGNVPLPIVNGVVNVAPSSTPPASNNCYYGQEIMAHPCGNDGSIQCVTSASCPMPTCLGTGQQGMTPCPGADQNLDQNYGITFITDPSQCNSTIRCEYVYNPCFVDTFVFPNPKSTGGQGQQCGDNINQVDGGNYAQDICAAYGYSGGAVVTTQPFTGGTYNTDFYMITPAVPTGGQPLFSLNGHTNAWLRVPSCSSYAQTSCSQGTPTNPNPKTIANATICPNQPLSTVHYTIASNRCDSKTACQVTCNAGYYAVTNLGPCAPYSCGNVPDPNATLCSTLPPTTSRPTVKLVAKCPASTTNKCQATCNIGYKLNGAKTACVAS